MDSLLRTIAVHSLRKDPFIFDTTVPGIFVPQREKTHLLTCAPNSDSNQPAHPRGLFSLHCLHE